MRHPRQRLNRRHEQIVTCFAFAMRYQTETTVVSKFAIACKDPAIFFPTIHDQTAAIRKNMGRHTSAEITQQTQRTCQKARAVRPCQLGSND